MTRKLPALNVETQAFWQGGRDSQLLIHYCEKCARYFHPPSPACPACLEDRVAPKPVSGSGRILSFTINHQKWRPDLELPYVVAIVELDEQPGLQFVTNIINCDPASVAIGKAVSVTFMQQEDVWIPLFEITE